MNILYKSIFFNRVSRILTLLFIIHSSAFAINGRVAEDKIGNKNLDIIYNHAAGMLNSGRLDDDPELKQKAIAVKKSYEEQKKAESAMIKSRKELEIQKEMKRLFDTKAGANKDMSQALQRRCIKELKLDHLTVFRMMERSDPLVIKILNKMIAEDIQKLRKQAELNISKRNLKK